MTIGVLSPYILRTLGDWTISIVLEKFSTLNKTEQSELGAHLIGRGDPEVTIDAIWSGEVTWDQATKKLGIKSNEFAILIASVRLLFWHWLQPFLYFYVLFICWESLMDIQRILGLVVCSRELLYWMMTIIAVIVNPVYLLVDLRSSWQEHDEWDLRLTQIGSYVIAPEKYVAMAIKQVSDNIAPVCFMLIFLPLLDMAGVAAYITAIVLHNVYPPLIIGYLITTVGGIFFMSIVLMSCCKAFCR